MEPASLADTTDKMSLVGLSTAVVDLIAVMNQSQFGTHLIKEAGLSLEPALVRILAGIHRYEPIGVVDLAERAGRDYTTVSRQVAKLQSLGLIERRESEVDRRIVEALLTKEGRRTVRALAAARETILAPIREKWSSKELDTLTTLLNRLVGDLAMLKDPPSK